MAMRYSFCWCLSSYVSAGAGFVAAGQQNSQNFLRYGRLKGDMTSFSSLKLKNKTFTAIEKLKVAEDDSGSSGVLSSVDETSASPSADRKEQVKADKEKGQTTAIVTGVIAVLLGVGYLVLVQLLDTRGIILLPPPPEAFEP